MSIAVLAKVEFDIIPRLRKLAEEGVIRKDHKEPGDCLILNSIIEMAEMRAKEQLIAKKVGSGGNEHQEVVDKIYGYGVDRWLEKFLEERPHYKQTPIDDLQEQAFGENPSLAARARIYREQGPDEYDRLCSLWGSDPKTLNPGKRPAGAESAPKKPGSAAQSKNPYLMDDGPERDKRIVSIVSALPSKAVADLARAAGCSVSGKRLNK
jgi:hypothetical protein